MASTTRRMVIAPVLFVLLLLVASEMGTTRVAEARHCLSQSHRFVGACMRERNCRHVCNTEGFPWGDCRWHGMERKCYCKRIC
ncbi:hypothetical protein QOZ80_4AG0310210 [Eleusine coracana subsp. coracana]|nr:hypothetical protein QOZ80_4AG0310210 [Eleusine coracana subsp. coracana]